MENLYEDVLSLSFCPKTIKILVEARIWSFVLAIHCRTVLSYVSKWVGNAPMCGFSLVCSKKAIILYASWSFVCLLLKYSQRRGMCGVSLFCSKLLNDPAMSWSPCLSSARNRRANSPCAVSFFCSKILKRQIHELVFCVSGLLKMHLNCGICAFLCFAQKPRSSPDMWSPLSLWSAQMCSETLYVRLFLCSARKEDTHSVMWSAVSLLRLKSIQNQCTKKIWVELVLYLFSIYRLVSSVSKRTQSFPMLAFLCSVQNGPLSSIMNWSLVSLVCSKSVVAPGCAGSFSFLPEKYWPTYDELVFCFFVLLKYRMPCNMCGFSLCSAQKAMTNVWWVGLPRLLSTQNHSNKSTPHSWVWARPVLLLFIWMSWLCLKIQLAVYHVGVPLLCINHFSFSDMSGSPVSLFCSKSLKIVLRPGHDLSWFCASSFHIWNGWLCLKLHPPAIDVGFLFSARNRPKYIPCNGMELCCFLLSKITELTSNEFFWFLCLFKNSLSPLYSELCSVLFKSRSAVWMSVVLFSAQNRPKWHLSNSKEFRCFPLFKMLEINLPWTLLTSLSVRKISAFLLWSGICSVLFKSW